MKSGNTLALAALALGGALPLAAQGAAPVTISVGDALARGRASGVTAAVARLAAQGVSLKRSEQAGALLPQVDVTGTVQRGTLNLREFGLSIPGFPAITDPFTLFRGRLGASQVIFDPGLAARLREARDTAIAAGLDADRAGDLAAAAAGAAWLRLAGAEETVSAREQDSVTAFALLDIARSQVDAGTSPRIDRTRSETAAAAVRIQIAVARNERDRARLELARAVDLPPGTPLAVGPEMSITADTLPTDIDAAIAVAKAHRPDLAAERQRQDVLQRGLTAIRNEFIPTLSSSGYVESSGTSTPTLAGTWNIGVYLSWSVFDGFRRVRRIDEQRVRLDAEAVRLHDLESQVDADVRQAVLDLASARDQLALATDRVRLAEEELSEARDRFAAGVAGSVETTNAQSEVAAAHDAVIQARLATGAAEIGAAQAMGLLNQVH
jgi:outer membrane protein TolC